MVALRSPCTALFSRCCQRRGGCHGGGEAGMASGDVVASVFRGGQRRRGWRRSEYVCGAEKRAEKKSCSLAVAEKNGFYLH